MANTISFDQFLATYVNTNIPSGAVSYDAHFLVHDLLASLVHSDAVFATNSTLGLQVLFAISCALKRADLVPALFASVINDSSPSSSSSSSSVLDLFYRTRETINIIWPFVGVPQVIPAALGLAGYLKSRDIVLPVESNRRRPDLSPQDASLGIATRTSIYKASANSEVFALLEAYHGDFAYALNAVGFGYNMGRAAELGGLGGVSLPEAELILTAALIALGATRQAGSHVKACVGFGYSEDCLRAVVEVADRMAGWMGVKLEGVDVGELARQARMNLEIGGRE